MVKTLQRVGNSSALVIEKAMMELLDIETDTPLRLTVEGRKLIVEPLSEVERAIHFKKAMLKTGKKHAALFKRLAK